MEYEPLPEDRPSPESTQPATPGGLAATAADAETDDKLARRRRLRRWVVYPLIVAVVAAIAGIAVAASIRRPEVADLAEPRLVTRLFDAEGHLVRSYSRENRVLLEPQDIPQVLEDAILSIEDANFYDHGGIDLKGVGRAAYRNFVTGRRAEGASTITMQLARGLFSLTRKKDWQRKIDEAFLAVELEKTYSKPQILAMYCNLAVNLGHGNYGMEAAARSYFNKSVADLTLAEAATLAGIPQRPSRFSVYRNPEAVVERRNLVLGRMLEERKITGEEHAAAVAEPLIVSKRRRENHFAPYFAEEVRRHLMSTYGGTELYDRGLQVETTLDRDIQRAAEAALREKLLALDHRKGWRGVTDRLDPESEDLESRSLPSWDTDEPLPGTWYEGLVLSSDRRRAEVKIGPRTYQLTAEGIRWTRQSRPDKLLGRGDIAWFRLESPAADAAEGTPALLILEQEPELEGAVVVIESATGAVRAMVGGWDYERNEFNRVTQAQRQVGSGFKPFVYGAALENGFTLADTLFDAPIVFSSTGQPDYSPRNNSRKYYGILTLRRALQSSINVTAVKLMDLVGVERIVDFARRCGVASELLPYPSMALGAADLIPLEIAAAYAAIANQGIYVEPYLIDRVKTVSGRTLEERAPRAHKAMEPQIAYLLTSLLHGVTKSGTAAFGAHGLRDLEIELAGKTGTTNGYTDAWFTGFTPRYAILTWVGYDQKRSIGRGMTGAEAALPIWKAIVTRGLEDGWLEVGETFARPPGISEAEIETTTGLRPGPGAEKVAREMFLEGSEPEQRFDLEWARIVDLPWYLQQPFYQPKEGELMPEEGTDWSEIRRGWLDKDRTTR